MLVDESIAVDDAEHERLMAKSRRPAAVQETGHPADQSGG